MVALLVSYFLRWLISWAQIIDGILGILSLGFYISNLSLRMATYYSAYHFWQIENGG
ncbi:MAG: hypothetical protein JRE40_00180 [Deltaproteobacteria bacterium]|nr:hypothetical protein [Deltaproteobacteria bacterium]